MLTFDNLGEAAALERGTWSPSVPIGRDPSVTEALPRLLDELDANRLTATFFVEAINCEHNPRAVREIAARGHELGVHGWRHEPWASLGRDQERALLQRGRSAFQQMGLRAGAFRPPGGEPTAHTPRLLDELGFDWWSPAAGPGPAVGPGPADGSGPAAGPGAAVGPGSAIGSGPGAAPGCAGDRPVRIPFDWELVDAYHLMDRFAPLRHERGDPSSPRTPEALAERFAAHLRRGHDGVQTVILHPFLMLDPAWAAGVRALLALLAALRREAHVWVGPGGALAARLNEAGASAL